MSRAGDEASGLARRNGQGAYAEIVNIAHHCPGLAGIAAIEKRAAMPVMPAW